MVMGMVPFLLDVTTVEMPWWSIPVIDLIGGAVAAYIVYKIMAWKQNMMVKKFHPTEKNGLNLDVSYRIDDSEVFGIHGRGVDLGDLIDNMLRGFNAFTKKKETVIDDKREKT